MDHSYSYNFSDFMQQIPLMGFLIQDPFTRVFVKIPKAGGKFSSIFQTRL